MRKTQFEEETVVATEVVATAVVATEVVETTVVATPVVAPPIPVVVGWPEIEYELGEISGLGDNNIVGYWADTHYTTTCNNEYNDVSDGDEGGGVLFLADGGIMVEREEDGEVFMEEAEYKIDGNRITITWVTQHTEEWELGAVQLHALGYNSIDQFCTNEVLYDFILNNDGIESSFVITDATVTTNEKCTFTIDTPQELELMISHINDKVILRGNEDTGECDKTVLTKL